MSLVDQLGARVAAGAGGLPVAQLAAAGQRLAAAAELLRWIRHESSHDLGTTTLAGGVEHLETATRALLVAQERLGGYLRDIGLAYDAPAATRPHDDHPEPVPAAGPSTPDSADQPGLGSWWARRIAELTGQPAEGTGAGPGGTGTGADSPDDLLRRVAGRVRDGGRGALASELAAVPAQVGLGLAALAPAHAHRLCTDLLGHQPTGADLARLTGLCRDRVRDLLPGLPDPALAHQLARICRTPPPQSAPVHPVDSAASGAVLVGVLLHRLGRGADALAGTAATGRDSGARHA